MSEQKKDAKRPYQPPRIEQVELVSEESVLQACRNVAGVGSRNENQCNPTFQCQISVSGV